MKFEIMKESENIIKVIGVGGGGSNAVSHMFRQGIVGVDFIICNTDNQAMETSPVPIKINLGPQLTAGRGAGSKPQIGKEACIESLEEIQALISENTKMVFITAGMGGGTGTGAAPIVAKVAREMDILTVGIVTVPFPFEGKRRKDQAMEGIEEMKKNVDALVIISNEKLRQIYGNLPVSEAFSHADDILSTAAKGIAEIITMPGYVNVDFEDVNTVMRNSGVAIMGTATVEGENRAHHAVVKALNSPLLAENDIRGAKHILLNISYGSQEVTMDEIYEITEYVQEEAGYGTDIIWGNCFDENLGNNLSVTIIATGFEQSYGSVKVEKKDIKVSLEEEKPGTTMQEVFDLSETNAKTIEFDSKEFAVRIQADEPFIKAEVKSESTPGSNAEEKKVRFEALENRTENNRKMRFQMHQLRNTADMENQPAYLRRNIPLDDVPSSKDQTISRWTISNDEEPQIRENNSFLYDNVD
ncbi:MAG: cell division protein FtsZ [Saprospiraceae bacterium]